MNKSEYIKIKVDEYISFNTDDQIKFLVFLGSDLTVVARETYAFQSEEVDNPKRLRRINETQHTLYDHIGKLLDSDTERYPDETLINIIFDTNDEVLAKQIANSFDLSIKYILSLKKA